jgi:hypothetical protein
MNITSNNNNNSSSLRKCVCCGLSSVQIRNYNKYNNNKNSDYEEAWIECSNAKCTMPPQLFSCGMSFCKAICTHQRHKIPEEIKQQNPWIQTIMPYYLGKKSPPSNGASITVANCIACCLSATIPPDIKSSLQQLEVPSPLPTHLGDNKIKIGDNIDSQFLNEVNDQKTTTILEPGTTIEVYWDGDNEYYPGVVEQYDPEQGRHLIYYNDADIFWEDLDNIEFNVTATGKRKKEIQAAKDVMKNLTVSNDDTMKHLSQYSTTSLRPPSYRNITNKHISKQRKKAIQGDLLGNPFVGAMYMPAYRLLIQSYCHNDHLYVDILAKQSQQPTGPQEYHIWC